MVGEQIPPDDKMGRSVRRLPPRCQLCFHQNATGLLLAEALIVFDPPSGLPGIFGPFLVSRAGASYSVHQEDPEVWHPLSVKATENVRSPTKTNCISLTCFGTGPKLAATEPQGC